MTSCATPAPPSEGSDGAAAANDVTSSSAMATDLVPADSAGNPGAAGGAAATASAAAGNAGEPGGTPIGSGGSHGGHTPSTASGGAGGGAPGSSGGAFTQGGAGAGGTPADLPVEPSTHGGNSGEPPMGGGNSGGSNSGGAPVGIGGASGEAGSGGSASGAAGMTSNAGAASTGTDCEGGKVVHFVYFVEADATYSEEQHADIEAQAYAFQQYWYDQLGVTFYLSEPIVDVIEADHESSWYLETPDGVHTDQRWYRLGNVKNEVHDKLGIRDFDPNHRVVNYPTTRSDGHVGGNFGGAWMDGDDLTCQAEPGGVNYPYDDGNAAHCLGHVVHEFGHVLGLDHEGPQTDCMQYGFYVSFTDGEMCTFSAENVAKILADPDNDGWFEAEPGETCRGE